MVATIYASIMAINMPVQSIVKIKGKNKKIKKSSWRDSMKNKNKNKNKIEICDRE